MQTMTDMQTEVHEWISQFNPAYYKPLELLASLEEESGEVNKILNCTYGQKKPKSGEILEDLKGEMGDVLFSIICIANSHKIDLDSPSEYVMERNTPLELNAEQIYYKGKLAAAILNSANLYEPLLDYFNSFKALAISLGISLEDAHKATMAKVLERDNGNRFTRIGEK